MFTGGKGVLVTAYSKSQADGVGYTFVSLKKKQSIRRNV